MRKSTSGSLAALLLQTTLCLFVALMALSCNIPRPHHDLQSALGDRKYGGVYRINMVRGNPGGLDPVMISSKLADDIALQIYDRLITFDSSLIVQPELALRWELSPDCFL